ncbi:hypothetical protein C8R46DRAFT_1107273 [Mycena filopes]|nr:hypothetical protein C8R46DRAFT_1107273 [Mycena filopes]
MDTNAVNTAEPNDPVKDDKYFLDDGDCMFLVQGTLFKVHKWALCRDPDSMFRGMFSIPQGPQGASMGLNPIPMPNDSANEFRALCWAVYALPDELHRQTTSATDVRRLINLVKMSHKYTLPAFESWALEVIRVQCKPPLNHLATCAQEVFFELIAVGSLCGYTELMDVAEAAWIPRLYLGHPLGHPGPQAGPQVVAVQPSQTYSPPVLLRPRDALTAGQRYSRRKFQADVYYLLSKRMRSHYPTLSPADGFSYLNLTDQQLLRLLSGHVLLDSLWQRLQCDPLPTGPLCSSHYNCNAVWASVTKSESSDVLSDIMQTAAVRYSRTNPCVTFELNRQISKLEIEMADYFLGPAQ